MNRIFLLLFLFLFSFTVIQDNKPILNDGYYYGKVEYNSSHDMLYFHLYFSVFDGDTMVFILPQFIKNEQQFKVIDDRFNKIILSEQHDTEYSYDYPWTISGFDNFNYYTVNKSIIKMDINVYNIKCECDSMDVVHFRGLIKNNSTEIESLIYSDYNTISSNKIVFYYKPKTNYKH